MFSIKEPINSKKIHFFFFLLFSICPFFWESFNLNFSYTGTADYVSMLNPFLMKNYFLDAIKLNNLGGDSSFLMAELPANFLFLLLHLLHFSPQIATFILISIFLYLSQVIFYQTSFHFLNFKGIKSNRNLIFFISVCYAFSGYQAFMIIPGHFYTLMLYAFFPAIIYLTSLVSISPTVICKESLYLLLIYFLCSISFANVGIIYVFMIAISIYFSSVFLHNDINFFSFVRIILLTFIFVLVSNIWWLGPYLLNLSSYINSNNTYQDIIQLVALASREANISNIFLGAPEGIFTIKDIMGSKIIYHGIFYSTFFFLFSLLILLALLISNVNYKKNITTFLIPLLLSIFFLKGTNQPFSDLFLFLYDEFPFFKVFRRPTSKFWGFYLFYFNFALLISSVYLQNKFARYKIYINIFFLAACILLLRSFVQLPAFQPFNVPNSYNQLSSFLKSEPKGRTLVLPLTKNNVNLYKETLNNYQGFDPVRMFLDADLIFVDLIHGSKIGSLNEILFAIRNGKNICNISKDLNISKILVRTDILNNDDMYSSQYYFSVLEKNESIVSTNKFFIEKLLIGKVFTINNNCISDILTAEGQFDSYLFKALHSSLYYAEINGLKGDMYLNLKNAYNENWILITNDFKVIKKSNYIKANDYNNNWKINSSLIKNNTNKLKVWIFYLPQMMVPLGFIIFLFCIVFISVKIGCKNERK
jgi:hypothetical protein